MINISPSRLYCEATALAPQGIPSPAAAVCGACGRPVSIGELSGAFVPPKTFNDRALFAQRGNFHVCGWCLALLRDGGSNGASAGCAHAGGLIILGSDAAKAEFVRDPPDPPFVVALPSIDNPQHIFWTAAVSYDRDRFAVRFGHQSFLVNRLLVISAVDAITAYSTADPKRPSAIFFLSHKLKDLDDFRYNPKFLKDDSDDAQTIRETLQKLSRGELWFAARMLRALAKSNSKGDL